MKRIIALLLSCCILLVGCKNNLSEPVITSTENTEQTTIQISESVETEVTAHEPEQNEVSFNGLSDPDLCQYLEDDVYAKLENLFCSDDYIITDIQAQYISKEYIEELTYNSQENIFFGYSLSALYEALGDTKFIFTLGDDGQTDIKPFEKYDDTYEKVIKNVAIGTGVILICVTVSIATSGAAAPGAVSTISTVFAASAKGAASMAVSGAVISGVVDGLVTGFETNDFEEAKKAALLSASEAFKWCAIIGAVTGGVGKAIELKTPQVNNIPTYKESEDFIAKKLGGETQKSFFAKETVPYNTPGSTRPDIVRKAGGTWEAVEIKNYDLENNLSSLIQELKRQITDRIDNLPSGYTQRIALDTRGRGYSMTFINNVIEEIQSSLYSVYPNIPISVF